MVVLKGEISIKPIPRTVRLENLAKREGWRTKIHSPTGSTYTGSWHNDEKHGVGEFISRRDHLFNGYFDHNRPYKFGVSAFGKGNNTYDIEYRGQWKDGHFHGEGVRHYRDHSLFKGVFVHSSREGFGQMWYAEGSYYEGEWHNDLRHGLGFFVEANGNRFEGFWLKGKKHGRGIFFLLHTGQYMNGVWEKDVCITSIMEDIPYRQTSILPTEYTINEVQVDDAANMVVDMIENTLLNLADFPSEESVRKEKTKPVKVPICSP